MDLTSKWTSSGKIENNWITEITAEQETFTSRPKQYLKLEEICLFVIVTMLWETLESTLYQICSVDFNIS